MYEQYQTLLGCEPAMTPEGKFAFTRYHALAAFMGWSFFTFCLNIVISAGSTEALKYPIENVQVLLQSSKYHSQFQNTGHALLELRVYGLKEYYRGTSA